MSRTHLRKLYIGGITPRIRVYDILEHFARFGIIEKCNIHFDKQHGRFDPFGFIVFEQPESVDKVQASRPHIVKGCKLTLKRAFPKETMQKLDGLRNVNRIFVGGLGKETEEDDLREYFSSFGRVQVVNVIRDRDTGTTRRFAFVDFNDCDTVDKIVLQNRHMIRGTEVTVKKAKSRAEMDALRQSTTD